MGKMTNHEILGHPIFRTHIDVRYYAEIIGKGMFTIKNCEGFVEGIYRKPQDYDEIPEYCPN